MTEKKPKRGTTRHLDPDSGVEILVTTHAEKTMGPEGITLFVENLTKFMISIEADYAYVSRRGRGLEISLTWSWK